ncbi:unnamed protein product [Closterium sp. Yama58-4]|nr:unnamed protein product [Closterium sp. Yama58-4]
MHGRRRRRKRRRRAELLAAAAGGLPGVVVPPKQNRTGYNFFFGEQRMKLKADMPDVPDREISRLIGQRWMALSPQDRIVSHPLFSSLSCSLWGAEDEAQGRADMPDVPNREISRLIGQQWMALSPQDRIVSAPLSSSLARILLSLPLSLFLSLSPSFFPSLPLSFPLSLFLSLSPSFFPSLPLSFPLSLFLSLSPSFFPSLPLSFPLSLFLSLSPALSLASDGWRSRHKTGFSLSSFPSPSLSLSSSLAPLPTFSHLSSSPFVPPAISGASRAGQGAVCCNYHPEKDTPFFPPAPLRPSLPLSAPLSPFRPPAQPYQEQVERVRERYVAEMRECNERGFCTLLKHTPAPPISFPQPYQEQAERDRERYVAEMREYNERRTQAGVGAAGGDEGLGVVGAGAGGRGGGRGAGGEGVGAVGSGGMGGRFRDLGQYMADVDRVMGGGGFRRGGMGGGGGRGGLAGAGFQGEMEEEEEEEDEEEMEGDEYEEGYEEEEGEGEEGYEDEEEEEGEGEEDDGMEFGGMTGHAGLLVGADVDTRVQVGAPEAEAPEAGLPKAEAEAAEPPGGGDPAPADGDPSAPKDQEEGKAS